MDIKRGMKRLYFSVLALWVCAVAAVFPLTIDHARQYGYWDNVLRIITTPRILPFLGYALLPPLALSLILELIVWIARGFKKDTEAQQESKKHETTDVRI